MSRLRGMGRFKRRRTFECKYSLSTVVPCTVRDRVLLPPPNVLDEGAPVIDRYPRHDTSIPNERLEGVTKR